MAWEEDSCISLNMQLIAILSRIGVVNQFDPARRKKLQYYSGQLLANRIREYSEVVLRLFCFRPDRIEILLSGKINQNRILQLSPII